jgi:hypothetical protein
MTDHVDDSTVGDVQRIERLLAIHGLAEAQTHLVQARAALDSGHWESANAQSRSFAEAIFNAVAKICLDSRKTAGHARKLLEEQRVLGKEDAHLVEAFFDVASGSGSHAGTSREEVARGRLSLALGLAYVGLALLPGLVRVEDVMRNQRVAPPGGRPPTDAEMHTSCPTCGETQHLSETEVRRDVHDTVYLCRNGCQIIVVVSEPGDSPWPGRGYRLGDHVIRNAADLFLPVGMNKVLIPASPAALMKRRPGQ